MTRLQIISMRIQKSSSSFRLSWHSKNSLAIIAHSSNSYLIIDGVSTSVNRRIPCSYLFTSSVLIITKKSLIAFSFCLSRSFFFLLTIQAYSLLCFVCYGVPLAALIVEQFFLIFLAIFSRLQQSQSNFGLFMTLDF